MIEKELAHQWWKVAWSELTAANAAGEIEVMQANIKVLPQVGLEPTTFGLEVQRAIHCATGAVERKRIKVKYILFQKLCDVVCDK